MNSVLSFDIITDGMKSEFVTDSFNDLVFLLDTGAETPVWCDGLSEFMTVFPNAEKIDFQYVLAGFGTGYEIVDAYRVPELPMSDGTNQIVFQNMVFVVTDRPTINATMILPGSVFNHMSITIDRLTSSTNPTLKITYEKSLVPIFFRHITLSDTDIKRLGTDTDKILTGVYTTDTVRS